MKAQQKIEPQRTCLGCGKKQAKRKLLRIICLDGKIRLDRQQNLPGRGTYLCLNDPCLFSLETKKKLKLWQRALKHPVSQLQLLNLRREIEQTLLRGKYGQG